MAWADSVVIFATKTSAIIWGPRMSSSANVSRKFWVRFFLHSRKTGKKTTWSAWKAMPEMTYVFIEVTEKPDEFSLKSPWMSSFEKLTCR